MSSVSGNQDWQLQVKRALNRQGLARKTTMKITTAAVIFMGSMMLMRADQLVESVQRALKDQGFYYGEVNGDMNANLAAAIRRYQIRNGLQVTGELNDETLRSLGIKPSGSSRPTTKVASPTPAPSESPSDE